MTSKVLMIVAAAALAGGLVTPGTAGASGTRAESTVTIRTENGDFWGQVKSTRPYKCAKDRKVVLFKQLGSEQNPKVDTKVASDITYKNGDRYEWSTGNTGLSGKFYARVGRTPDCKPDTSKTVRSTK